MRKFIVITMLATILSSLTFSAQARGGHAAGWFIGGAVVGAMVAPRYVYAPPPVVYYAPAPLYYPPPQQVYYPPRQIYYNQPRVERDEVWRCREYEAYGERRRRCQWENE